MDGYNFIVKIGFYIKVPLKGTFTKDIGIWGNQGKFLIGRRLK
jgi:hypothetical protein